MSQYDSLSVCSIAQSLIMLFVCMMQTLLPADRGRPRLESSREFSSPGQIVIATKQVLFIHTLGLWHYICVSYPRNKPYGPLPLFIHQLHRTQSPLFKVLPRASAERFFFFFFFSFFLLFLFLMLWSISVERPEGEESRHNRRTICLLIIKV